MHRRASVRRPFPPWLLLGLGLGLAGPVRGAEDDELRSLRDTRRVLREHEAREDLSEAARVLARARRHEAMELLRPLIQQATGERRAEMILRLAEFYAAESDDLRFQAWEVWEICLARDEPTCGDGPAALPAAQGLLSESVGCRERAERLYAQVIQGHPQHPSVDHAAWGQALALLDLERPDEALRVLMWLVKNQPESEHVPTAYVLIGDHHFDRDRALPALNAYRKSAAFQHAEIRPYANYKLAWCYFNLGEQAQAIDVMRVVALDGGGGPVDLREEALRDLARFYADAGDLDGALRFYGGLNRPDLLRSSMERVASHAKEQGKHELAVRVLRQLITELPHDVEAPGWQAEIVRVLHAQGRDEATTQALELLLRDYGPQSAWARANAADGDALREADRTREAALRSLALDWHQQVGKLRHGPDAERAARSALAAYRAWLQRFEDRPEAHELRYAYAELLFRTGQREEAWLQYREVVTRDPGGARSLFCAESAVYVADEITGKASRASSVPPGTEPLPLSTWEQRLVDSVDGYLALQPEGERSLAFATKAAWLLYHRNHFAEAADRFTAVIALDPGSEEAEIAANLILDSLALVGDYGKLAETAEAFLQHPGLGRPGFDATLRSVHERARFRLIEAALEASGDRAAAASAFETHARSFPAGEAADLALHNAAVHHRAVGDVQGAIRAGMGLIQGYPSSEHRAATLAGLGFDHESVADFEGAAGWYERLAREAPEHDDAPDALWSASLFRVALGQDERAIEDLALHARRWPDHPRQGELLATVAELHEQAGRQAEAASSWSRIGSLQPGQADLALRAHALVREGRALRADGREDEAQRAWQAAVDRWAGRAGGEDADEALRESVAEALYHLGVERLALYEAIDLGGHAAPGGRAAAQAWARRQVVAKARALQEVELAHAAVIDAGSGGWGLAALVRLGGAYEHMADCLRGAWVPPWLTPEQAELYRLELEDEAWRQEEKAAEAYRQAVGRSRQIALYGEAVADADQRLASLRPEEGTAPAEELLSPTYLGVSPASPPFEREP
jgi:tetratricopeptide (TPR) repeat protein